MPRAFTPAERSAIESHLATAALDALRRGGIRKTSIDVLCRAAGISKGAFYAFHDSKEALVLSLLQQAEQEIRAELLQAVDRPNGLFAVLTVLFDSAATHPMLGLLRHPEDYRWLTRAIPQETLQARQDDDHWFSVLFQRLVDTGQAHDSSLQVFLALPTTALALAQSVETIGPDRFPLVRKTLIASLSVSLRSPLANGPALL